jgi:hypothetical protein
MKLWYYAVNDQLYGPLQDDDMREILKGGWLTPDTFVWSQNDEPGATSQAPVRIAEIELSTLFSDNEPLVSLASSPIDSSPDEKEEQANDQDLSGHSEVSDIKVIDDKIKFATSLGIPSGWDDGWVKDGIIGLLSGTAAAGMGLGVSGAITTTAIAGLGFLGKAGLLVGLVSIPAAPIALPVLAGLGATMGIGTLAGLRLSKIHKKFSRIEGRKSFNTPLGRLGVAVSVIVFAPVIGFSMTDGFLEDDEVKFISTKMNEWGYSQEYIDGFIKGWATLNFKGVKELTTNWNKGLEKKALEQHKNVKNDLDLSELKNKAIDYCEELYNEQGQKEQYKDDYIKNLYGKAQNDVYQGEIYPGVMWYCAECGALLNKQDGFKDSCGSWICAGCHHSNPISGDAMGIKDRLMRPFRGKKKIN